MAKTTRQDRWYGSLDNRLAERARGKKPEVGMGVTEMCYSDRHPYEIIEVKDERHITIRRLDAKRIDNNGMSECQEYEYTSREDAPSYRLYLNNEGRWVRRVGKNGVDNSSGWYVGAAEEYFDFSF